MKILKITKYNKKIKVVNKNNDFIITGPLGILNYKVQEATVLSDLFLNKINLYSFLNKIKNLFKSVSTGWFMELNLKGIGYKSFKMGDKIALDLGYSNLILYKPTSLVKIKNLKNKLILFSINKNYLHNVASILRNYAIPNVYKGKGILYKNEIIKLKKKAKN